MKAPAALPSTMFGKRPLYLSLLLLTQCSKCKLDNPTPLPPKDPLSVLPAKTQTGASTFGCLVNGKAYATISPIKCRGDWQGARALGISGDANAGAVYGSELATIDLLLNGNLQSGQVFDLIPFKQPLAPSLNQFAANAVAGSKPCVYEGNYIKTGKVELLKFDGLARIASGRFAFTLCPAAATRCA
jgi:hypothetical protein